MDAQHKNRLAELIEQLPEEEIQAAVRYLEYLKDRGGPYLKFLMSGPEENLELIDKFQRELDETWKYIDDGQVISSRQLKQDLGSDQEYFVHVARLPRSEAAGRSNALALCQ